MYENKEIPSSNVGPYQRLINRNYSLIKEIHSNTDILREVAIILGVEVEPYLEPGDADQPMSSSLITQLSAQQEAFNNALIEQHNLLARIKELFR